MKRRDATGPASHIHEDDVDDVFDVLRQNLARADAMVCATEHQLERFAWGAEGESDDEEDDNNRSRRLDHLAHLLGATKEAVRAAVYASGDVAAKLARRQKGT
jgi:hypothetical protein